MTPSLLWGPPAAPAGGGGARGRGGRRGRGCWGLRFARSLARSLARPLLDSRRGVLPGGGARSCPPLCPGQKEDTRRRFHGHAPVSCRHGPGSLPTSELLSAGTPGDMVPSCLAVKSTPFLPGSHCLTDPGGGEGSLAHGPNPPSSPPGGPSRPIYSGFLEKVSLRQGKNHTKTASA